MGLNRKQRRDLDRAGIAPEQAQDTTCSAFVEERYLPGELFTIADDDPGPVAKVQLQQFTGLVGKDRQGNRLYHSCKTAALTPETAIAVGEALAAEGRRLKSGLVTAGAADVPNLRGAA